ncbi:MAG: hypothetical protein HC815_40495 [Richelia sp. RM1_1_1]|nr:hypothetical protein [Richelia sp. RM1_1_1]
MKFESWRYNYSIVDDGAETWEWAEFFFRDDQPGILVGKSPIYIKGASDYYCLFEDAPKVALALENGATWEEVSGNFREAW